MSVDRGRIVITGLGAVSAWGWGVSPLWAGLLSGRTAIGPLRRFDPGGYRTSIAAQAPTPPAAVVAAFDDWEALSHSERFALAAAREALAAAGMLRGESPDPDAFPAAATGVFFGGSTAGMIESEEVFAGDRSGRIEPWEIAMLGAQPIDVPASAVARRFGCGGPIATLSSACASGTQALGAALDALQAREVEVALAGGADSLCRLTYAGFNALRVVDEVPCRPFRDARMGMSLGEGAGVLVLETRERALARGARPLAELLGVGNSCDAHHMTAPHPAGTGAALAVERALADGGVGPDAVAWVNAHGTGTPLNDLSEWLGLAGVFGARAGTIPLTATKASVGHLLGSSGAIEGVATVRCLEERLIHPTPLDGAGDDALGETPVALVLGQALPVADDSGMALSTSFGFGGANAAALFAPAEREPRR